MAKLRYKRTHTETHSSRFNVHALSEVDVGDDSAFFDELDVFLESTGEWKDMRQAFKDRDLIPNDHNTHFAEPRTDADRQRGWYDG